MYAAAFRIGEDAFKCYLGTYDTRITAITVPSSVRDDYEYVRDYAAQLSIGET